MGVIIYNGVSSEDVGVFVETYPDYAYAGKSYASTTVEGRPGLLVLSEATYNNASVSYSIAFKSSRSDFDIAASKVVNWLHSCDSGYARLEDSYEPSVFRKAVYNENGALTNFLRKAGRAKITFNCLPQRFLKSGEDPITITSEQTIVNETVKSAKPLIEIHGSGTGVLEINGYQVSFNDISDGMLVDCELENVYKNLVNLNNTVTVGATWFPKLDPGNNTVRYSGGITSVIITPRWWMV